MKSIVFLLFLICALEASKKFRSEKINYIYDKALNHLKDRQKLARLEKDLSSYDGIYMDTKEMHSAGKVDKLHKELSKIDKKLIAVLEKYELSNTVQAFKEKMKHKNVWENEPETPEVPSDNFSDEKLQSLWSQALGAKFSDAELVELHKELKEVERKMQVYDDHLNDFDKVPHENSVHFDHDSLQDKTKKLKRVNKELNEHLDQVHQRITKESYSPFTEPKVKKLWKMAQDSEHFSVQDMSVLKQELLHFENQLKKISFHQKEIDNLKNLRAKDGKSDLHNVESAQLDGLHEKLNRKAKQLEKYLEKKIRHTEL